MMKNKDTLFTIVDGFRIPSDKAAEYKRMRDKMAAEGEKFLRTFCVSVKKMPLFDLVGSFRAVRNERGIPEEKTERIYSGGQRV